MIKKLLLILLMGISTGLSAQDRGYLNVTTFGFLAGTSSDQNEAPISFISEHHYQFNKTISAGFMTGIEQLNENTLPLAGIVRVYAGKQLKLFLDGYIGYSVSLEKPFIIEIKKTNGGVMTGVEAGILLPVNECNSVIFAMGYRYSELHYQLEDWWVGEYKRIFTYNRFTIRLGITL